MQSRRTPYHSIRTCIIVLVITSCVQLPRSFGQSLSPVETKGYWKLESNSISANDFALDSSGNGNHLNFAPSTSTNYLSSVGDSPIPQFASDASNQLRNNTSSLMLDGTNHLAQQGDFDDTFTILNDGLTLEAWVKLDHIPARESGDTRQTLFQQKSVTPSGDRSDNNANYIFHVNQGQLAATSSPGGPAIFGKQSGYTGREMMLELGTGADRVRVISTLEIPADDQWHFVAASYDANDNVVRFWKDGPSTFSPHPEVLAGHTELPIAVPSLPNWSDPGPTHLIVGAHTGMPIDGTTNTAIAQQIFEGQIDELRVSQGYMRRLDMLDSEPILPGNMIDTFTDMGSPAIQSLEDLPENEAVLFFEKTMTPNMEIAVDHLVVGDKTVQSLSHLNPGSIPNQSISSFFINISPMQDDIIVPALDNDEEMSLNLGTQASYRFETEILGLSVGGANIDYTTGIFGISGVDYGDARGLEIGDGNFNPDYFSISPDRRTLMVDLRTGDPGLDQIRVFTVAVPEPSTIVLMFVGASFIAVIRFNDARSRADRT